MLSLRTWTARPVSTCTEVRVLYTSILWQACEGGGTADGEIRDRRESGDFACEAEHVHQERDLRGAGLGEVGWRWPRKARSCCGGIMTLQRPNGCCGGL